MDQSSTTREWLGWLTRVRLLTILLIFGVGLIWPQFLPAASGNRIFLPLLLLWIFLALVYIGFVRWLPQAIWQGALQVASDIVIVSALVYSTGLQESSFISLYLLVIIVASILFSRRVAFATAGFCLAILGGLAALAFAGRIPPTYLIEPTPAGLRAWFFTNLFGFLAVAYLASLLAQSLRSKGIELEEKREELLELQDFTEDIIHSMRGGLLTTDLEGRIVLLNRTGEEILGYRFVDLRGRKLPEVDENFWLPGLKGPNDRPVVRREIEFRTPDSQQRYLGISVSPLRTRNSSRSGYVFNFQDLTELRRLEQEVATKDRMAALGRLSAAIAHEIRQPLTAMAGAVKELARLVPLEEDEKHLVGIVSRESERLNKTITEFLNYSREKTYDFSEEDVSSILDETLTLLERNPQLDGKYRIERAFTGNEVRVRVDRNRIKQVFWNLSDNALRAMPDGGTLTVSLEAAPF